ncbi:MAG: MBL fold metallo-hydrolase [bacterium]|nr:MBL fold metallo-hydrolase [bacterium]
MFGSQEPGIGNCVAVLGDRAVLVVDSALPSDARAMIATIRETTDTPVRYLLNTHWHDDHIWGNQEYVAAFPEIEILAHTDTRRDILARAVPGLRDNIAQLEVAVEDRETRLAAGVENEPAFRARLDAFRTALADFRAVRPQLPFVSIDGTMAIDLGGIEAHLIHPGRGHTRGDLVVHLPAERILITGDLLTHPVPAAAEAYPVEWVETMQALAELQFDTLVPGHGPVLEDRTYFDLVASLLDAVVRQVRRETDAAATLAETKERVDVSSLEARLTKGDERLARALARFFLDPAIEAAYGTLSGTGERD